MAETTNAQKARTTESVSRQFTQNKVPGLVYKTATDTKSSTAPHVSTADRLKNEGMANVPMAKGTGAIKPAAMSTLSNTVKGVLTSDKKAETPAAKQAELKQPDMQGGTPPKDPAKAEKPSQEEIKPAK